MYTSAEQEDYRNKNKVEYLNQRKIFLQFNTYLKEKIITLKM